METLSTAAQDDSSGANPSSVKSDDSSPQHDSGRGSPPPKCAICLGTCRNKSFTDSCLHQFCFKCLLTWSKVKAECPLCKQNFRSIIHNVQSNHQYEEYMVEQRQTEEITERIDLDNITTATRRFRYRTTLTLPRRDTFAIQQLLLHYPIMADVFPEARVQPRRRSPTSFRRTVYRHNLWARPLPDFTGRFRDCSPVFYRYNTSQMHRLAPWLTRELHYLLNENVGHVSYVISKILELLPQYHINSPEFREAMQRYFGDRTEHFLHELYCFASTPYDMTGYDRNVQYTTDTRISTMVNEVISSSESEASVDSDIVMVSSSEPAEPPPGPSRVPAPVYPQNYIPEPTTNNVIPIETLSQSDTDDDSSEVMVVGYIKPPQDRTPEVVDLLGSDSDVIVQDNAPEPPPCQDNQENRSSVPLVKLSLKRHRNRAGDSESEDSSYRPPPPRRKKRHRSNDTATTSDTCRTTPSPARSWDSNSSTSSQSVSSSPTSSSISSRSSVYSDSSSTSSMSKKRVPKNKSKRKNKEVVAIENSKKKTKKKSSRSHHKEKKATNVTTENEKTRKHKSDSGKGVKSSKKVSNVESVTTAVVETAPAVDQPSTSGTVSKKLKLERDRKLDYRSGRESRRLKSVVNVINSQKNSSDLSSNSLVNEDTSVINNVASHSNTLDSVIQDGIERRTVITSPEVSRKTHQVLPNNGVILTVKKNLDDTITDSEDDLPLNLTVQKRSPCSF
ncbi:unnamed protein product [Parnassius apollo]|uniref:E3 ubiquitin-protein ligase Topors n=1 Tax=Parnassius apollo TaxID=110799 RepID=A0A8S3WRI6_PARAO|nr:unnamed protein product [Parnassius apollo]